MNQTANPAVHPGWTYKPPINDELLLSANFFDLYPMDGGGRLVTTEMVSFTDDKEFARQVLEDDALADFGVLPELDFRRFERWRTVQKSCWINRFYWLVPLAKQFCLTRDKKLADLVVAAMLHFIETCPPPENREACLDHLRRVYQRRAKYNVSTFEEIQRDETDIEYIWFDLEPASRSLHWIYALHFLKLGNGIDYAGWKKIADSLYQHAEVVYYAERYINKPEPNNHQSMCGAMLLHLSCFFEGIGLWREFRSEAVKVVNFQSAEGFYPDGALKEISPSYHIYQTMHVRDAYLLSRQYDFELDSGMADRLKKHAGYIRGVTCGGETVTINDSYPVRSSAFLDSIGDAVGPVPNVDRNHFPDAGILSLQRPDLSVLLDASPFTGRASHYHLGKNALTIRAGGKPFLVDSGCCQYDDEKYMTWYRLGTAHSSLLVDGQADGDLNGFCDFSCHVTSRSTDWRETKNGTWTAEACLMGHDSIWKGVNWSRSIEVAQTPELMIADKVEIPRKAKLLFIFNLAPGVTVEISGKNEVTLRHDSVQLKMKFDTASPEITGGQCFQDFKHCPSSQIRLRLTGTGTVELRTAIIWRNQA